MPLPNQEVRPSTVRIHDSPSVGRYSSPVVIGTSFRDSNIDYRERLVHLLEADDWIGGLPASEWALIKTCNRVEIAFSSSDPEVLTEMVSERFGGALGEVHFHAYAGCAAISYLFRVASGLDSMIVNDGQILAQMRAAGKEARKAGTSKAVLPPLFDAAVSVGERAKTVLGRSGDSVGAFAIKVALKSLRRRPKNVVIIGTGKMSRIAASTLADSRIRVVTRRSKLPSSMKGVEFVSWRGIKRAIRESELVLAATKSEGYVVHANEIVDGKEKIVVDLGFPRNVDPALRGKPGIQLLDLDDLAKRSTSVNPRMTRRAEAMVELEASEFNDWLGASKLSPQLPMIFRWADRVRLEETETVFRRLRDLSPRQRRIIEAMGRRITSKLLAKPAAFAKASDSRLPQEERIRMLSAVFMEGSR